MNLIVKNISNDVYTILKQMAGRDGLSLNAEIKQILTEASHSIERQKMRAEAYEELQKIWATLPIQTEDSVTTVRQIRDERETEIDARTTDTHAPTRRS